MDQLIQIQQGKQQHGQMIKLLLEWISLIFLTSSILLKMLKSQNQWLFILILLKNGTLSFLEQMPNKEAKLT